MNTIHSYKRRETLWFILITVILLIPVSHSLADRKILLLANLLDGYGFPILELKPSGEIVTTGQILSTGNYLDALNLAVSPDQQYLWSIYSNTTFFGLKQFAVTPYGQVTATGRVFSLMTSQTLNNLSGNYLRFTPNGQMLLLSDGPIFHTYPDGSIQSTGNVYIVADLNINPRGDINFTHTTYPSSFRIDYIDYNSYTLTNLQILTTNGQPQWQTVYTPSGDYLAYTRLDGEVDIWKILSTGMVDTTKVWHFPLGSLNSRFLTITPNGTHIYVSYEGPSLQGISRLDWYSQDTPFVNSGSFTPLSYPIQVEVSPDGQFLVAVQQVVNKHYLRTYSIQADGSLVDTGYSFPYTDTFGDTINNASNLIFVYPPAPTDVPSELWGKLE